MPINDPEKSENMRKSIRVYSGSSNRPLAQKIAEYLGVELSGLTLKQFANGEIYARYDETVRGADVFLIQSVAGGNVNDMLDGEPEVLEQHVAGGGLAKAGHADHRAVEPHVLPPTVHGGSFDRHARTHSAGQHLSLIHI